jgi:hypothetical protein
VIKILSTLGPGSLNKETVKTLAKKGVNLFRINLSHTALEDVEAIISKIQSWTDVPVCLDSEGAQIRNGFMESGSVVYQTGDSVTIHPEAILGDRKNISFTPGSVFSQLNEGDEIRVDFDSAAFRITEVESDQLIATVLQGGRVGSNKGAVVSRPLHLDPITPKDKAAFETGHWEGDLVSGSKNTHIATLVDRKSRYTIILKLKGKDATSVTQALTDKLETLPQALKKSLTWDRGMELAKHAELTEKTGISIYFCDPQSPWQRGTNENTNSLIRQYFPKKTCLAQHSQEKLNQVADQMNNRPRKTLMFETPKQVLQKSVALTG